MASVSDPRSVYSEFTGHFDDAQRQQLIDEDLAAGRSVSLELICIVLGGALLMVFTVAVTLL